MFSELTSFTGAGDFVDFTKHLTGQLTMHSLLRLQGWPCEVLHHASTDIALRAARASTFLSYVAALLVSLGS